MKNILKLFLTIWLLFSAMSCGDKDDEIDYIHRTEIHYVNETGVSPIILDFYSNNVMKISVSINNNDTSFVATELNDCRWMLPDSHDSVIVKFGDMPSKTFIGKNSSQKDVKNPCRSECYEKEYVSNTQPSLSQKICWSNTRKSQNDEIL